MGPLTISVQNSSPFSIHAAASRLRGNGRFPANRWLSTRNRYAIATTDRLHSDGINNIRKYKNQLAEYIAASTIIHCMDGWNFFSCAIDSLINQDFSSAVFMAYYAELRAVMSFFANEGIGIFDNEHFWFNSTGEVNTFTCNTHNAVQTLIQKWALYPPKNIRILELMKYDGISFSGWLNAANMITGSPATSEFAKDWLKSWSIDLDIFSKDHDIRNEASYRPQGICINHSFVAFDQHVTFLKNLWKLSEPSNSNSFNSLDRVLLKNTLERIYFRRTGRKPVGKRFSSFLKSAASNLGLSPNSRLIEFLSSNSTSNSFELLQEATKKSKLSKGEFQVLPVIARALLLLRLSSASVVDLIDSSGISKEELKFWWSSLGNSFGFWNDDNYPNEFTDLWVDIDETLKNIDLWQENNSGRSTIIDGFRDYSTDFWYLHQFQRVGLWATGL